MKLKQPKASLTNQQPHIPSGASGATTSEPCTAAAETLETSVDAITPGLALTNEFLQRTGSAEPLATKLGISLLYAPLSEPLADLILVHVPGGTSHGTWFWEHNPDHFWPLWIPQDAELSRIRIFTFGYSAISDEAGLLNIADHSRHLLRSMTAWPFRSETPIGKRPIIFVAHSIGGLVVKKAYMTAKLDHHYQEIASQIRAILFLGTPHQGFTLYKSLDNILRVLLPSASVVSNARTTRRTRGQIIQYNTIRRINDRFRTDCADLQLVSLYETRATQLQGPFKKMIVEKDSAVLGLPSEVSGAMDTDHRRLSKFRSVEDPNYLRVRNCLRTVVKNIGSQVQAAPEAASGPTEMIQTPGTFNLRRNRHFTGRQEILEALHETLDRQYPEPKKTPPHLVVLHGVGGVGKTEIAREYLSSRHWKQAPSTAQSDHIENEVDGQQADEVEIESVLSNLPSLTAGSTISSALTLALIEDIKADVLTILTKDEELHELLQETPKRITHDKFQRNFLRLFRAFVADIGNQPESEEQELRQVIRVLRYQSRNIASHICQHIFDLKEQSGALLSLAQQTPDKGGQLISFFGDDSTPELVGVLKDEPLDDGESSGSELEEPETVRSHHVPLGDLEIIILESKSFLRFREQYRAFLFPRPDPQPLEEVIPTDGTDPRADRRDSGTSPRPTSELLESASQSTARPSVLEEGFAFVRIQIQRWMRVPVKDGYMRIDWRCDCGDELYADFSESDADSVRQLEACLKGHTVDAGGGTATSQTSHPPGRVPALTAATGSSPSQPLSNIQPNNTGQPSSSQNQSPAPIGGATQANVPGSQASKRFIELCVNTGEFQHQLAEIDISTVASDAQLFDRIRERYREVRSFRTRYFLLKPVDVHFVQFSVEDRHRVGILDKPMAIPSVAEMAAEGYAYYPCPLRPPPIPANIFLHHLSKAGKHPKLLWGNRIPQKLHNSILQAQTPNDLVTGWGVHIIEGLNKTSVLVCSLAGLLISGIVAVVWAVVKDDVQGGFGIGAWLTSVQAIVVMLVVTKWLET